MKPFSCLLLVPANYLFSLASVARRGRKKKKSPPNIVFIMSDDHAYQAISAYSDQLIQTPIIDR